VRQPNPAFAIIGLQQLITAKPQQLADEQAILVRILNHQNSRHATFKCNITRAIQISANP